jgi:hypothetical protein
LSAAASANPTSAYAVPVDLRGIVCRNAKASIVYLKLYDMAGVPAATDTPKLTIALAASSHIQMDFPTPIAFEAGLGYRLVTGNADNDATAVLAGDVLALNLLVSEPT